MVSIVTYLAMKKKVVDQTARMLSLILDFVVRICKYRFPDGKAQNCCKNLMCRLAF